MKKSHKNLRRFLFLSVLAGSLLACEGIPDKTDDDGTNYDGPPKQIIPVQQAKTIYDSYTKRRVPIIKDFEEAEDSTQEFHPTRYGQYSYETMKHYMSFIEEEAKLAKVEIKGLRFYFANYPADGSVGSNSKYARHNTFFLLPTTDFNGEELGFFIRVDENGNRKAVAVRDLVKNKNTLQRQKGSGKQQKGAPGFGSKMLLLNPVFQSGNEENVSLILNDSQMVPPPRQDDDFKRN